MPSVSKIRIGRAGKRIFQYVPPPLGNIELVAKDESHLVSIQIDTPAPTIPPEPPSPPETETFYKLQEDGSSWLLETEDYWLTQEAPPYMLLEIGGFLSLEDGGNIELEGSAS